MKYRVKLKTTVTAWVEVAVNESAYSGLTAQDFREIAADDAVSLESGQFRDQLTAAGLEHGPIELAYEELDESVEVIE
jgi:hypothetical protein